MKESWRSGLGFGVTSGIVTTAGLIVGLGSGTHSTLAVLGGIVALAVSDGLSEAMGLHVAKKAENAPKRDALESTLGLLASKFFTTLTFAIPILLTNLKTALVIDVVWGLLLLAALTAGLPDHGNRGVWREVAEHEAIAIVVIAAAYATGLLVAGLA